MEVDTDSNVAKEIPIPLSKKDSKFKSISNIPEKQEILILSFSNPNSIVIFELEETCLKLMKSISIEFEPHRSLWLPHFQRIVVWPFQASRKAATIPLDLESAETVPAGRVQLMDVGETVEVSSSALFLHILDHCEIAVFDSKSSSIRIFKIS